MVIVPTKISDLENVSINRISRPSITAEIFLFFNYDAAGSLDSDRQTFCEFDENRMFQKCVLYPQKIKMGYAEKRHIMGIKGFGWQGKFILSG